MALSSPFRYASACDGISAVRVAWAPLGWECAWVSEIDPFCNAVSEHHHPGQANLGDMATITEEEVERHGRIGLMVAGTPCQSFSVAGKRAGLDDSRGVLAFEFLRLAGVSRPDWLVWENVPGVLSSNQGEDFAAIIRAVEELGYGWAYRILDAQYIRVDGLERAVPQRRRRVFVVGYLGDWRPAAAVLLERESLSGNPPPRRQAGKGAAAGVTERTRSGGRQLESQPGLAYSLDNPGAGGRSQTRLVSAPLTRGADSAGRGGYAGRRREDDENLVAGSLSFGSRGGGHSACRGDSGDNLVAYGGNRTSGPIDVSPACNAHPGGSRRLDFESEAFVAHSLRAEGFDASEDGTGRGTPVVPIDMRQASRGAKMTNKRAEGSSGGPPGTGIGQDGDPSPSLSETHPPAVAFQTRIGRNARGQPEDICPTLQGADAGATSDMRPCVAYGVRSAHSHDKARHAAKVERTRALDTTGGFAPNQGGTVVSQPLRQNPYNNSDRGMEAEMHIQEGMAVRRLTPIECARLQGFPDDYLTQVAWRGKCPPADGSMYRALGNAMAVNVMRWIGRRIDMVREIMEGATDGTEETDEGRTG